MTDKTDKKVWFITGAGRGMGVNFVKAALVAGADAIGLAKQKVADLQSQIEAYRDLSTSIAFDEHKPGGSAR
jgi:NAD(P)-dependent dehydrogenase (short-subunit alcohol dehydrogenase family)